jgi:hypothetical protein
MGSGHRRGWKKAEIKKGLRNTSMPENHISTEREELALSPSKPVLTQGGGTERQGRFLFITLLSSNLFALFVGGLYEYLALRGVVDVAASRMVLIGAWLVGILIAGIIIWISNTSRKLLVLVLSAIFLGLALWGLDVCVSRLIAKTPRPTSVAPAPVSIYLGCSWDAIPIHIPAGSAIHVIQLHPAILKNSLAFASTGVFQDVSSTGNKPRDWPSKTEGRWMTDSEMKHAMEHSSGMPSPFAFKCTISGYSPSVVEDLVATLVVEAPSKKYHSYPVYFDPLITGSPFTFYIVSVCSSGVTPIDAQWDKRATLHMLGENGTRHVPLKYERRNWPADLMPVMGPSAFLWNGIQSCDWDSK